MEKKEDYKRPSINSTDSIRTEFSLGTGILPDKQTFIVALDDGQLLCNSTTANSQGPNISESVYPDELICASLIAATPVKLALAGRLPRSRPVGRVTHLFSSVPHKIVWEMS